MALKTPQPTPIRVARSGAFRGLFVTHPIGAAGIAVIVLSLGALVAAPAAGPMGYYIVTLIVGFVMLGVGALALRRRRAEAALLDTERALKHFQQATTEARLETAGSDALLRDPDTLLFSRQFLDATLERELRRAAREKAPVTILMVHIGGVEEEPDAEVSAFLRAAGAALQQQVRAFDVICRCERQVLGVLMPGLSERLAARRARELLDAIEKTAADTPRPRAAPIVASAGLATHTRLDPPATAQTLLRRAYLALYQSRVERGAGVPRIAADNGQPGGTPDRG